MASAVEQVLKQNHAEDLKVFVVWEPILPTDWSRPSLFVQHRIRDPRVVQFWDKDHLVAKELRAHLAPQSQSDPPNKFLWDVVAFYPNDAKWDSVPTFTLGPVFRVIPELTKQLALKTAVP